MASYIAAEDHVLFKIGTKKVDRLPASVLAKAENIMIPEGAEEILERAFEREGPKNRTKNPWGRTPDDDTYVPNTILKTISIPSSLRVLGFRAFCGCRSLTRVDLTHCTSLTSMMDKVFSCCVGLTVVSLPASLEMIGQNAFYK
jgi:hypothetical protein